jgi:general secretion pathway protein L
MNLPVVFYNLSNEIPSWILHSRVNDKNVIHGSNTFADGPDTSTCVLVVPADRVTFLEVELPKKNRTDFLKALPFAVEDRIMVPPDSVHVIAGTPKGNSLPVAIIDRKWLRSIMDTPQQAGYQVTGLYSEISLLPIVENGWSLFHSDQGWIVRTGSESGFLLPDEMNTPDVWQTFMGDKPPQSMHIHCNETIQIHDFDGQVSYYDDSSAVTDALTKIATGKSQAWNLLPDEFATHRSKTGNFGAFKTALSMLVMAAVVHITASTTQWITMKHESQQLRSGMESSFKKAFPQVKTIVDPEMQMKRNMADLLVAHGQADSADLLSQLQTYGKSIQSGGGEITGINYHNGVMTLRFKSAADIPTPASAEAQKNAGTTLWKIKS